MNLRLLVCLLIICLAGACAHRANNYNVGTVNTTKADESKTVFKRFPGEICMINDSIAALANSAQVLSLYNIHSGVNIANSGIEKTNFDSLIGVTYQKKYEGVKRFVYGSGFELNGNNYQLGSFVHSENRFFIHVSTVVEVYDLEDSPDQRPANASKDTNMIMMDYLNFIFVADADLKIEKIYPLYAESISRKKNFYPYYQKNFYVENNALYVPVGRMDEPFKELEKKMNCDPGNYSLVCFNFNRENAADFFLDFKHADFSDFRLRDYIESPFSFFKWDDKLLFCNGKEIYDVKSGEKLFDKKELDSDGHEWIYKFRIKDDRLLLITGKMPDAKEIAAKKENGEQATCKYKFKIIDQKTSESVAEYPLPGITSAIGFSDEQIVYMDRDKENYSFKYIRYNEN